MTVINNADMSKYTSFRAGGIARRLVIIDSPDELISLLAELKESGEKYLFLGNGSNTLFLDGEFDGTVIKAGEDFEEMGIVPLTDCGLCEEYVEKLAGEPSCECFAVSAGSAALLSKVAKVAASYDLTGLEFAAGIPGSIGGGVFMNAGAYDGEIKDVLCCVTLITEEDGKYVMKEVSADELDLGYRHSKLMETGEIIVTATFILKKGNREEIEAKMKDFSERRSSKQPLEYPSAGSFFKRPEGNFAGKLIQEAELAGLKVGGAQVSEKHCGFIINKGDATATDIVRLMRLVQNIVDEKFGIRLEPEVRLIGEL